MITTAEEYNKLLYQIQSFNKPKTVPIDKNSIRLFDINLNTREIVSPETLTVQYDHNAETIYFKCDRYFDSMDLSHTVALVQYENAGGEYGIYFIPFFDVTKEEGKIIFPWVVSSHVTKFAGTVLYSVRFYLIDPETSGKDKIIFSLNTKPTKTKITAGGPIQVTETGEIQDYLTHIEEREFALDAAVEAELRSQIAMLEKTKDLYWTELD